MNLLLFLISNAQILIVSIWCLLTCVLIGALANHEKFRKYFDWILQSRTTIPVLIFSQVLVSFFFPAYRNVVISYLFLFLVGLNLHNLIIPTFLKSKFSYFVTIPVIGLALISLFGAYFIAYNIKITFLVPTLLGTTFVSLLIQYKFLKGNIDSSVAELRLDFKLLLVIYTGIITPIIFCLLLPVI